MLSKRIRFIVLIVACSLAGIFLFQCYWLYNSYLLSTKQFENDVQEVLQKLQTAHVVSELKAEGNITGSNTESSKAKISMLTRVLQYMPDQFPTDSATSRSRSIFYSFVDTLPEKPNAGLRNKIQFKGKKLTISTGYNYKKNEFAALEQHLRTELDTLLKNQGIYSTFAFKLSNASAKGDNFISDSTLFANSTKKKFQVFIGLSKPYLLQITVSNHFQYVFKQMQWVLLASVLMIGITILAFVYMLRTIFQQKKLSEIKTDFINNMTHEFKTPISTVSLAVEAMKSFDVMKKPEQAKEYLDICEHELKRISVMIEKVLRMAAFERSEIKLSLQKKNIGKLINDVATNMRPQLEQRNASLSIKPTTGKTEAMIDADHFSNVIYNLIDNSLKYTDEPPEIEITYGINAGENLLEIVIGDNGIGIPEAYHDKVFDSFFRVPTGNLHKVKGFGLGLNYVAGIVKKHNGTIELKSSIGKGTFFIITVPV